MAGRIPEANDGRVVRVQPSTAAGRVPGCRRPAAAPLHLALALISACLVPLPSSSSLLAAGIAGPPPISRRALASFRPVAGNATAEGLSRSPGYFAERATPHFRLYAPLRNRAVLDDLARDAEAALAVIGAELEIGLRAPVLVFILSRAEDAAQLAFPLPGAPEWADGYAVPGRRAIVLKTAHLRGEMRADVPSTFRHELIHILLDDAAGANAPLLPRWFNEGMAMTYSQPWGLREVIGLSQRLIRHPVIPLNELDASFPEEQREAQLAYSESFLFLSYLRQTFGAGVPGRIVRLVGEGKEFPEAFREATGRGLAEVEASWLTRLRWRYRYIPIATSSALLWLAATLLFLLGYLRKRRSGRRTLERWEEEEGSGW